MTKEELRFKAISTLKKLTAERKKLIEVKLLDKLINSEVWKNASHIGITISQGFEWDTKPIIEAAWAAGKSVSAPKCTPKGRLLHFYTFNTYEQLEVVYYNLLEPIASQTKQVEKNEIDLIVVPGVLFDHSGFRIGFGGGYYDRFLTDFKNNTVALVSEIQLVEEVPNEAFDIPVSQLITEAMIIETT